MTTATAPQDLLDEEWLLPSRRVSRWSLVLLAALVAALLFLAGVEVQKHLGTSSASTPSGLPAGLPSGLPAGLGAGFPDLSQLQGAGAPGTGGGTGAPSGDSTDDAASAVVGKVVSVKGDVWKVEDLGGHVHEVTVSNSAKVLRQQASLQAADLEPGDTVDIASTKNDSGDLTAITITIR